MEDALFNNSYGFTYDNKFAQRVQENVLAFFKDIYKSLPEAEQKKLLNGLYDIYQNKNNSQVRFVTLMATGFGEKNWSKIPARDRKAILDFISEIPDNTFDRKNFEDLLGKYPQIRKTFKDKEDFLYHSLRMSSSIIKELDQRKLNLGGASGTIPIKLDFANSLNVLQGYKV